MTDIDTTDLLREAPAPALRLLAEAIDREFARRAPVVPTPYEYAAGRLGIEPTGLVVLSESPDPPVAHSVGHWLHDAQHRWATVLETSDTVTTEALLAQAREGGWRASKQAAGQYL